MSGIILSWCYFHLQFNFTTAERVFFAHPFFSVGKWSFRAVLFSRFSCYLVFIISNITFSRYFIFAIFLKCEKREKCENKTSAKNTRTTVSPSHSININQKAICYDKVDSIVDTQTLCVWIIELNLYGMQVCKCKYHCVCHAREDKNRKYE